MTRHHDLRLHCSHAAHGDIEVVDLEPQQDAVALSLRRIADRTGGMLDVPVVQLENQPPVRL